MNTADCPRTTLVEALRDGRLGAQESASMERHLEGCAECAEYARDLAKIGEAVRAPMEKATPLEHQRARVALLQKAATQAPGKSGSNGRTWAFGAVLMAASVILGFVGGSWNRSTNEVAVAMHLGALPHVRLEPTFGFHPSDDARFTSSRTANLDELTIEDGTIYVKLPKLEEGKRFVVHAAGAEIEVRSTAFRVEVAKGRFRGVAVEQGTVDVQYAGFMSKIEAGGSFTAPAGTDTPDKPAPKTENDVKPLVETSAEPPIRSAQNIATIPMAKSPMNFSPTRTSGEMDSPAKPTAKPTETAAETAPPTPKPASTGPSIASRTFADAMAAMRDGDYAASAEKLEKFAETHAGDARADEADYLRAIALQRAGKKDAAIAAAQRYLATRPNGAHRADAERIVRSGK